MTDLYLYILFSDGIAFTVEKRERCKDLDVSSVYGISFGKDRHLSDYDAACLFNELLKSEEGVSCAYDVVHYQDLFTIQQVHFIFSEIQLLA